MSGRNPSVPEGDELTAESAESAERKMRMGPSSPVVAWAARPVGLGEARRAAERETGPQPPRNCSRTLSEGAAAFEWLSPDARRDTGFSPWGFGASPCA